MKHLILTVAAFFAALTVSAASVAVDFDSIKASATSQPEMRRQLVDRFAAGDTLLTPVEMALVYYGQAFTPGYARTETYADVDSAYLGSDMPLTLTLVDEVLRTNPVALSQLFRGFVASKASKQPRISSRAGSFENRIMNICDLIYASGTGVDTNDPFRVLTMADAEAFLRNYIRVDSIMDRSRLGHLEAVKTKVPGIADPVIFYFALPE